MPEHALKAAAADSGRRADSFVAEKTGISRAQVQKLIKGSLASINGGPLKPNHRLKEGDMLLIHEPEPEPPSLLPEQSDIKVTFMDDHVAVLDKPPGLVVHPSHGHPDGTLLNALFYHSKKLATVGGPMRPGVVHRLDMDTSGLIVVALTDEAYYSLVGQFKERTVKRRYLALLFGQLKGDAGEIDRPIGRSSTDGKKMSTRTRRAKTALTRWSVVERFGFATLVHARLSTGRTHQIRVHFSALGHPVLGDATYGRKRSITVKGSRIDFPRQMLHADTLGFTHPVTGKPLKFRSPMPQDMKEAVGLLRDLSEEQG